MKIGIFGVNIAHKDVVEKLLPVAVKADELGVESLWTAEHVLVPVDYQSRYPFDPSGKLALSPESLLVDPLITLSHVAAVTKKIKLATGINLLAQSNPLLFAKQTASVDYLSRGRLILGLGVGWLAEEFSALGVPFEKRGARMDDYMVAIKKVWSGEVVEHQSEFIAWSGFKSHPRPHSRPHPPIVIGGHSAAALRRTARFGDGWFAFTPDIAELTDLCGKLRAACQAEGRDPATIEITSLWDYGQENHTPMERYAELGISRLLVFPRRAGREPLEFLDILADEVLAKL